MFVNAELTDEEKWIGLSISWRETEKSKWKNERVRQSNWKRKKGNTILMRDTKKIKWEKKRMRKKENEDSERKR